MRLGNPPLDNMSSPHTSRFIRAVPARKQWTRHCDWPDKPKKTTFRVRMCRAGVTIPTQRRHPIKSVVTRANTASQAKSQVWRHSLLTQSVHAERSRQTLNWLLGRRLIREPFHVADCSRLSPTSRGIYSMPDPSQLSRRGNRGRIHNTIQSPISNRLRWSDRPDIINKNMFKPSARYIYTEREQEHKQRNFLQHNCLAMMWATRTSIQG